MIETTNPRYKVFLAVTMLSAWHDDIVELTPIEVVAYRSHLVSFIGVINETLSQVLARSDETERASRLAQEQHHPHQRERSDANE